MSTAQRRDYYFDNLKFILITLVVIGHTIEPLAHSGMTKFLYMLIYSFHMPLFVFVSGYFGKKCNHIKLLRNVAIPYIAFQLVYFFFNRYALGLDYTFSLFTPYWIMWYLLSLLIWQLVVPMFQFRYSIIVAILFGILVGYDNSVSYFFSLSRTIYFFPFFLIGYKFNKDWFFSLVPKQHQLIISIIGMVFISTIFYYYFDSTDSRFLYGSYPYAALNLNTWYAGVYRVLLYAMTILISSFVLYIVPSIKTFFTTRGSRTLYVYLLHGFVIKAMIKCNIYTYFDNGYKKLSLVLIGVIIAFILSSKFYGHIIKTDYTVRKLDN